MTIQHYNYTSQQWIDRDLINKKQKKEKLIAFANSVMDNPHYSVEFNSLLAELNLTKKEIIQGFLEYNLDIFSTKGNLVYDSPENRVVLHIHNLLKGSWHITRQKTILEFIKQANPTNAADIGFGVPSKYVKELVLNENQFHLALCDLYESAFSFARVLLGLWDKSWNKKIDFIKTDMDKNEFVGDFDLYIFQDSIEHTYQPEEYLDTYVQLSYPSAKFLISLPIGPIIPRHFIAWETKEIALNWLKQRGLKVEASKSIFVNPSVDLFAEEIDENYCDFVVLCSKIKTPSLIQ